MRAFDATGSSKGLSTPIGYKRICSEVQGSFVRPLSDSLSPQLRWRALPGSSATQFTRDYNSPANKNLPMHVKDSTQIVTPDATPYDVTIALSRTLMTQKPNPIVFDENLALSRTLMTQKPNPVVFDTALISGLVGRSQYMSPIVFDVSLATIITTLKQLQNPVVFDVSLVSPARGVRQYMNPVVFDMNLVAPGTPISTSLQPIVFDMALALSRTVMRQKPNPVVYDFTFTDTEALLTVAPVVFTLGLATLTFIPGPITKEMFPIKFYQPLPFPITNYFGAASKVVASDAIKSVTYLAVLYNSALGLTYLPVSSIQWSAQNLITFFEQNPGAELADAGGPTDDVTVQVPNGALYATDIAAYFTSEFPSTMATLERVTYQDGRVSDRALSMTGLESVQQSRGSRNFSISIRGVQASGVRATQHRTIANSSVRELRISDFTTMSARVAYDIRDVRESRLFDYGQVYQPRDVVTIDGTTYVLTKVSMNIAPNGVYYELSSGA